MLHTYALRIIFKFTDFAVEIQTSLPCNLFVVKFVSDKDAKLESIFHYTNNDQIHN